MKANRIQFLGPDPELCRFDSAAVAVLPFPYEGGVSYGHGAGQAPQAILDASCYVEFYDEVLRAEPHRMGIFTAAAPAMPKSAEAMQRRIYRSTKALLECNKFVVVLGGDHSISSGFFKALHEKSPNLGCVQLDAHSDLRDSYDGSRLSHASVMARIREMTPHTLQMGIRAMCVEEAQRVQQDQMALCTMHSLRKKLCNWKNGLHQLPEHIFLTVDVDAFDLSVISSTGTPEPGGFTWDEGLEILEYIFKMKTVVGFDAVELAYNKADRNSAFNVARLVYKMLGFRLHHEVAKGRISWPAQPAGPLFF
jgi:agmatinase